MQFYYARKVHSSNTQKSQVSKERAEINIIIKVSHCVINYIALITYLQYLKL